MISFRRCLLLVLSFAFGTTKEIKMNPCRPGTNGAPMNGNNLVVESLTIDGCDTQPCVLVRGKSYLTESIVNFNYAATSLLATCTTEPKEPKEIPTVTLAENMDLCNFLDTLNGTCKNIKPGTVLHARGSWPVPPIGPSYVGVWRLVIADDSKVPQYCGELKVSVQNKVDLGLQNVAASMLPVPGR